VKLRNGKRNAFMETRTGTTREQGRREDNRGRKWGTGHGDRSTEVNRKCGQTKRTRAYVRIPQTHNRVGTSGPDQLAGNDRTCDGAHGRAAASEHSPRLDINQKYNMSELKTNRNYRKYSWIAEPKNPIFPAET